MGDFAVVRSLKIQFDRNNGIYMPGEHVSGKVLADFSQPKQIRGLRVVIIGESMVQWFSENYEPELDSEYQPINVNPTETMTGREEYFSSNFYLLGSNSGSTFMLPAGQMAYPFKFQLPNQLPSSFEHGLGYVRYTIRAIFDRPWEGEHEVQTTFRVVCTYDLNRKSEASLGIREDIIKNFFCSCICPTGKIYARLSVPSTGFVPGQMIPVTVHCENESIVDVTKIKVSLWRKLEFHAKSPHWTSKSEESIVAQIKRVAPFVNNSEERITIELKVPQLPPTGFEHCGLIDVDYALKIVMCFSGMHFSVKRRFPILIGTVPLNNSVNSCNPNSGPPLSAVIQHPSYWDSKNLSPPSYESSLYGYRTIGNKNDYVYVHGPENPFAPRYPVYNCGPNTQSLILP